MDIFWWEDFRKRYITPFFSEVRRRTDVHTSTKFIPCCHWHAIDEFESVNMDITMYAGEMVGRAPVMAFTKQDICNYKRTGDLFVIVYNTDEDERDWIRSIATLHNLSFEPVSEPDPMVKMYVIAKKYAIRPHMNKMFLAICRIRIALNRAIEKLYRPPNGSIFRKLLNQTVNMIPITERAENCPPS
tara:strand:+ start:621 stop:1181 length:561 start_codon:yes stop_codon:yes gene_type:complete